MYQKDDQIFHCYGRRSNRYLLSNYGFCLNTNKYDTLRFKIQLDFGWINKTDDIKMSGDAKEEKVAKIIKLKENSLKDEVFAYVRANLIKKEERWSKKTGKPFEKKSHLLIS